MPEQTRSYVAIDLKSFYASVECKERNLDPLTTNLVVADPERTTKTICLAVSPALKAYGIPGRARLFEVVRKVKEINDERKRKNGGHEFTGQSCDTGELKADRSFALDYITAVPRMALYMKYSTRIYDIYLKYVAPEDMHVYSVDEVFMDVTSYLNTYKMTAKEFASMVVRDVLNTTGITATAGIGTNIYLCKIAMDIVAKHTEPNQDGVRIAELDEMAYRRLLWNHKPLTDFWRIGSGIARRLDSYGIMTMGDIAKCQEDFLYNIFGIDAELLIDHAWGRESTTIKQIKAYKPGSNSISSGQVLACDYNHKDGEIIIKEMADMVCLEMVEKNLITKSLTLHVGYSNRLNRKAAHGTVSLDFETNSDLVIIPAVVDLYNRIVNPNFPIRRVNLTCNGVVQEECRQYSFFVDIGELERNNKIQKAMIEIKNKYGKNAIVKGMDLQDRATTMERNEQIGGHRAGRE